MSAKPFEGYKKAAVKRTQIETGVGFFDFTNPRAQDVDVYDIAAALSKVCRFAGHCHWFYSVAEHALLVRELVIRAGHPELGYAALHHDSEEAYLGDVTTPLKALLGEAFQKIREPLDAVVGESLDIDPALFHHPAVVAADLQALRSEAHVLKPGKGLGWGLDHLDPELPKGLGIRGLNPDTAEARFLNAHIQERLDRA